MYIKVDEQFGLQDHVFLQNIVSLQEDVSLCTYIFVYIFRGHQVGLPYAVAVAVVVVVVVAAVVVFVAVVVVVVVVSDVVVPVDVAAAAGC